MLDAATGETVELLQQLIRNACVNDGTAGSGHERRSVDVLRAHLEGPGVDVQEFEPLAGRASLVARIEGSDPGAPTLCLLGHADVVPADPAGWRRDPHGGELVDGEVWGRGAVDMLNLTASMAVATRRLAASGFRPRGTLVYAAVADEEAGGTHGAHWLTEHALDAVAADYLVTEWGGFPAGGAGAWKLPVSVAEKGMASCRLAVRGTPGHGSRPYGADNALVKAAEVVRRIAAYRPEARISETWRAFVEGSGFPPELAATLTDPDRLWDALAGLPPALARHAHACTHTTFSPNVVAGGTKMNVIPERVELQVDVRTLPGQRAADVVALFDEILGDLGPDVEVTPVSDVAATASPTDTPLWEALARVAGTSYPGVTLVPSVLTGGTDARWFRPLGTTCYGFGLFSERISTDSFAAMFHGHDERVDVESLRLSTELWGGLARVLLG